MKKRSEIREFESAEPEVSLLGAEDLLPLPDKSREQLKQGKTLTVLYVVKPFLHDRRLRIEVQIDEI